MNAPFAPAKALFCALSISMCVLPDSVFAQDAADDQTDEIDRITVVGRATNSVITVEEIETYQANDLSDIFRLTPSVSVGGSFGIAQKIYVRGLEDAVINVTVDGAQQTSTLFHHIGRVTIDPDLLKQVDIQAGAGEATSGPGAIGGAIRFRTKDATDLLDDGESFGGKLKASLFTNDGTRYNASLYGRLSDSWGVLAYYSDVDRDDMEDGDGNKMLATSASQKLGFLKVSGDIGENQHLSISYEKRDEDGMFSSQPNWMVRPDKKLYRSEAKRETLVGNYSLSTSDALNVETTLYQTKSSFRGGRFDWLAEITTFGLDLRNTTQFDDHTFTYGIDYREDEVESGYAIPKPEENHAEEGSVLGLYVQGHSQVTDALLLSYGLRYDDYKYKQLILLDNYYGKPIPDKGARIENSELSLNAGLSYEIDEFWTFGLGYAEASRGKEIGDGFTLDGYLYDKSNAPVVDPNLKAEQVANIEASIDYNSENFAAKLAVFDSEIDNAIFERQYGNSFYQNIGTVETKGFEIDFLYRWTSDLEVMFGFASTDSKLDPRAGLYKKDYGKIDLNGYEFNRLGNSRGDTWNLGIDYTMTDDMSFGANLSHVTSLTIQTLHQDLDFGWVSKLYDLNKPSYTTVDVFAKWVANEHFVLNLAVTNLLNEQYRDHSSIGDYSAIPDYKNVVGLWEAGRDIRLSVTYQF